MNAETEHDDVTGGDPETIAKIALAHLEEEPDYYTKLFMYVEGIMKDLTPDEEDLVKKNLKKKGEEIEIVQEFQIPGTEYVLESGDKIVLV